MKKLFIFLGIAGAILTLMGLVANAAPTSTPVQNLVITGLAGGGTECLHILNNGLVGVTAGSDCGSGSGGGSSTLILGANGVSVTGLVNGKQTSTLDTTYAATYTAQETFSSTTFVNGGLRDVSSTSIIPTYTYSVCNQVGECDYSTLEAALLQASTTQAATLIHVHGGTYTVPSGGYKICSNNLDIEGEGPITKFNYTAGKTVFLNCDTTQRSRITLNNFLINNNGTAGTGILINAAYLAISNFTNITGSGSPLGGILLATSTSYDLIQNFKTTFAGLGGYGISTQINGNDNTIMRVRLQPTDTSSTGIIFNSQTIDCYGCEVETNALTGVEMGANARAITLISPHLEGNQTNLLIDSGARVITVEGGQILSGSVANITDNGGLAVDYINLYLQSSPFTSLSSTTFTGFVSTTIPTGFVYSTNGLLGSTSTPSGGGGVATTSPTTPGFFTFFNPDGSTITANATMRVNTTTNQITITTQSGSGSQSVGGGLNINGTNATTSPFVVYDNQAAEASGQAVQFTCDTAFNTFDCFTVRGLASGTTAIAIQSNAVGKGSLKITHSRDAAGDDDSNASNISLAVTGTSSVQQIFMDAASGTTGNQFTIRDKGVNGFTLNLEGVGLTVIPTSSFQGTVSSSIASALWLAAANGTVGAYAGSSCVAGSIVTSISATGTVSCVTTSSILSSYSTSTGANPTASIGTTAVNGTSPNYMRADGAPALGSQFASSTITFPFLDPTSTAAYAYLKLAIPKSMKVAKVMCDEFAAATTTIELYKNATLGSTSVGTDVVASLACGIGGTTVTSFTTSTLSAGDFLIAKVTAIAGTPQNTEVYVLPKTN